ncbi:J domain-containing protein [Pseudomonas sp. RP23018S]|uniref:J domain-containing protein n=1 Tax=Pseudomonas sp. RP23018S TaxID=3096037 RepID=UPI002ACAB944|nr:J domain-containing protein [Pseudomonas sp. RP23018S]MDZ5602877.1 J domain-containing protein [Pseudomonas sp. RP23018S]
MPRDKADRHDLYATLGLTAAATDAQVKAAYRRRAMDLHPDRNPGRDTTPEFQRLNEAYSVLSTPARRAEYDRATHYKAAPDAAPDAATTSFPAPVTCMGCAKVSAQPRVVIFRAVKSLVLVSYRRTITGVYCSDCAQKQALKASASTWLLGWWSVPWGPIYTVQALVINLLGGTQPPLENARMLAHQAAYFYATGRPDLAQSLALRALEFANKIPSPLSRRDTTRLEKATLIGNLQVFMRELGQKSQPKQLKNSWSLFHKRFFVQAGALVALLTGIGTAVVNTAFWHDTAPQILVPSSAPPFAMHWPAATPKAAYVRPETAPNGRPWPTTAGYLAGVAQSFNTGLSEVTIDNSKNSADVFLKVVALQGAAATPVRQVFVPAYGQFVIKKLVPGAYDIRYRALDTGELSRAGPIQLHQTTTSRGTEYSLVTVTLYKVASGNTASKALSEDQF